MQRKKVKFSSIKVKLTGTMLLISFIGMILIFMICYRNTSKVIVQETLAETTQLVNRQAEKINGWLLSEQALVETLSAALLFAENTDAILDTLTVVLGQNPDLIDVYVGFSDDSIIFVDFPVDDAWKATQRTWYQQAMAAPSSTILSDPYFDDSTSSMVITISRYVGKVQGMDMVCAADVQITKLSDIIANIQLRGDDSYSFLVSGEDIIIHPIAAYLPTDEKITSMGEISAYTAILNTPEENRSSTSFTGHDQLKRYYLSSQVEASGWTLYVAIPQKLIYQSVNAAIPPIIVGSITIMAAAAFFIQFSIRRLILTPLKNLSLQAESLVNGDFTEKAFTVTKDEIGILMEDYTQVTQYIEMVIKDMNTMAEEHNEGNFDYTLEENQYNGAYREMVTKINAMSKQNADILLDIMTFLEAIGKGQFSASVQQYPGKLSMCNRSVESFRKNLGHVNKAIQKIQKEVSLGNLSFQANLRELEGNWAEMVSGLNKAMQDMSAPISEMSACLLELSQGKLNTKVTGQYQGEFAKVKNALNNTVVSLSTYISDISGNLRKIADNNLNITTSEDYKGDFIAIQESMNIIIDSLSSMVVQIRASAQQVNDGAKQIYQSSEYLSDSSVNQSEAISHLTTQIDFVNTQSTTNAENAKQARHLSMESNRNAKAGTGEMQQMLAAMENIKIASGDINEIIQLIKSIAFQTNLLSLNANIEAARAGQHGKGFAVVANEVGMLANRSAEAAKKSEEMIKTTLQCIEEGTGLAYQTSETLNKTVENTNSTSLLTSDVYEASVEQNKELGQMQMEINNVEKAVNAIAATSEQASAIANELSAQAQLLHEHLNKFQLPSNQ